MHANVTVDVDVECMFTHPKVISSDNLINESIYVNVIC